MKVIKHKDKWYLQSDTGYKEILLSTDDQLVKEGIQAINDEFLEWFVKNPSCEFVKIVKGYFKNNYDQSYKIIIPKEEHDFDSIRDCKYCNKKHLDYACDKQIEYFKNYISKESALQQFKKKQ